MISRNVWFPLLRQTMFWEYSPVFFVCFSLLSGGFVKCTFFLFPWSLAGIFKSIVGDGIMATLTMATQGTSYCASVGLIVVRLCDVLSTGLPVFWRISLPIKELGDWRSGRRIISLCSLMGALQEYWGIVASYYSLLPFFWDYTSFFVSLFFLAWGIFDVST